MDCIVSQGQSIQWGRFQKFWFFNKSTRALHQIKSIHCHMHAQFDRTNVMVRIGYGIPANPQTRKFHVYVTSWHESLCPTIRSDIEILGFPGTPISCHSLWVNQHENVIVRVILKNWKTAIGGDDQAAGKASNWKCHVIQSKQTMRQFFAWLDLCMTF